MRSVDDLKSLPDEKNWYLKATTAIRNQGQCGSCWAYSCVEQVESAGFSLVSQEAVSQNLAHSRSSTVMCLVHMDVAAYAGSTSGYDFIERNGGLASYAAYPDTAVRQVLPGNAKMLLKWWNDQELVLCRETVFAALGRL